MDRPPVCEDKSTSLNASQACGPAGRPACPVCGGRLLEIRGKLQCAHCRTICETCCEGGRG